jgi:hypothetical protein
MPHLNEEAARLIEQNTEMAGIIKVEHVNSNCEHVLNMGEQELNELTKEDCVTAQFALTQYSMSVNRHLNNLKSKLEINQHIFNRALIKVWKSYDPFIGKDLIIASACSEYSYLATMQNEILKLQAVIKDMDGIVERTDKLSQTLKDLSFCKHRG